MVKLLIGKKGSGKTKTMLDMANEGIEESKGSVIFINKNQRLMCDLKHKIRVVCMEDFPHITNSDEYIGFLYGIISSDHDIEKVFIDSILKHADINEESVPEFIERLKNISKRYDIEFIVSLSLEREQLKSVDLEAFEIMN
ncbi:MAG: hypothetical protein ACK5MV_05830 [Aminipila sp.]